MSNEFDVWANYKDNIFSTNKFFANIFPAT